MEGRIIDITSDWFGFAILTGLLLLLCTYLLFLLSPSRLPLV